MSSDAHSGSSPPVWKNPVSVYKSRSLAETRLRALNGGRREEGDSSLKDESITQHDPRPADMMKPVHNRLSATYELEGM